MYDKIKMWYDWGLWTSEMVMEAVPTLITKEQAYEIIGVTQNPVDTTETN